MFDHTNENMADMESLFDSSQINFRKIEKLMKLSFKLIFIVFSIAFIIDTSLLIVFQLKVYYYVYSLFWAIELLMLTILYSYLTYLMASYHNYEYQIHKKTLFWYFLFTAFMCSVGLYLTLVIRKYAGDKVSSSFTLNARDLYVFCNTVFN
jgi:hypothetical protein